MTAMGPYFTELFGNPHSNEHVFGQRASEVVELARSQVARLIGAEPDEIVFTSGATEANNLAILGVARKETLRGRDTILASVIEHASVLETAQHSGLNLRLIPVDHQGFLQMNALRSMLDERVRLVSIGWVNNEIGTIQNIAEVAEAVRAAGALLHVDAAQALTAVKVNVSQIGIDFLSLSSHKAYGPKGIGALYISPSQERHLKPLFYGGGQERGLRAGTLPTPLCAGFGAACAILHEEGEAERMRVEDTRDQLFASIRLALPDVQLIGPMTPRHPSNLSLRLPVEDARDVLQMVRTRVACSTGSACHSGDELPSHVLSGVGLPISAARQVIRLGVGRFTRHDDCEDAVRILADAVSACKAMR